jgi:hypothetical protein
MSDSVQLTEGGAMVKVRNPWGVLGLSIITLGIYYCFYWYSINREMRDVGQTLGVDLGSSPATSTLAFTLGAVVFIPFLVTVWTTGQRMERTQRALGITNPGSGGLFFVLHLVPILSIYAPVYLQKELDRAWKAGMLTSGPKQGELVSSRTFARDETHA